MESALHRGLHSVQDFPVGHTAYGYFLFCQRGHPRTGTRHQSLLSDAPGKVAAAANGQTGIPHTVGLHYEFFYLF